MTDSPSSPREHAGKMILSRYRRVLTDGAWVLIGQVLAGVFMLLGNREVTRYVHPAIFGAVSLLLNLVLLPRTVVCSPVMAAALRFYPAAVRDGTLGTLRRVVVGMLARSGSLLAVSILLIASIWSYRHGASYLIPLALAAFLVFDVGRSLELSFFSAARRQRPASIAILVEAALRPTLIVLAVIFFGESIQSVFGATAAAPGVILLGLALATHREGGGKENERGAQEIRRNIWRYALPMAPAAILVWVVSVSDRYIIEWYSHDAASVGIYAAAYGLISQPFIMAQSVVTLTLRPIYFNAVASENHSHARRTITAWLMIVAAICIAGVILAFLLRDWLVASFLAPQYKAAAEPIPWIALGYLFYDVAQVLEQCLLAQKRTELLLVAQTVGAVASVIVTIPLVARFGLMGAAYACPGYFLLQALAMVILVRRPIRVNVGQSAGASPSTSSAIENVSETDLTIP